jgi:hypothetical protein
VQYCVSTCSAVDAAQRTIPLPPGAQSPASGNMNFRRKGRPARDIDPLAGQVSGK